MEIPQVDVEQSHGSGTLNQFRNRINGSAQEILETPSMHYLDAIKMLDTGSVLGPEAHETAWGIPNIIHEQEIPLIDGKKVEWIQKMQNTMKGFDMRLALLMPKAKTGYVFSAKKIMEKWEKESGKPMMNNFSSYKNERFFTSPIVKNPQWVAFSDTVCMGENALQETIELGKFAQENCGAIFNEKELQALNDDHRRLTRGNDAFAIKALVSSDEDQSIAAGVLAGLKINTVLRPTASQIIS
jgi:hypothetical protein